MHYIIIPLYCLFSAFFSSFSSILRLSTERDNASNNGLGNCASGFNHLYLQASKLLDLALTLPSDSLPQFQMYKWAFINKAEASALNSGLSNAEFRSSIPDNSGSRNGEDFDSLISASSNVTFGPFINRIERYMRLRVSIS